MGTGLQAPVRETTLRTGCKLNLHLEISATRADGYHELETLFYPLPEPSDVLRITPAPQGAGLRFDCSIGELATADNLVVRVFKAFAAASGFRPDLTVYLEKNIPFGAGLGGGSADAAALLAHLNAEAGAQALPAKKLLTLAAKLGADVPFFLYNKPAWGTGIGEKLSTKLPFHVDFQGMSIVLVCPDVRVNTAWAYAAYDKLAENVHKDAPRFLTCRAQKEYCLSCSSSLLFFNRFEAVIFPTFPKLRLLKEELLQSGAIGALMSGSGSSIFGLFRDTTCAAEAAKQLKRTQQNVYYHHC